MVKIAEDRAVPREEGGVGSLYRRKLPLLRKRIQRKSVRRVAREIGVSHPTLLTIVSGKAVSRRIMVKVIQKTTGKKRKIVHRTLGYWFPDSI